MNNPTNKYIQLNSDQETVMSLNTGKHIVTAPPGTGKTELLAQRTINALQAENIKSMLCLTFTNRAAREMLDRIDQRPLGKNYLFVGSIHGFCSYYLHSNQLIPSQTILLDEEDSKQLMKECLTTDLPSEVDFDQLLKINAYIKRISKQISPDILMDIDSDLLGQWETVCKEYEAKKSSSLFLDFDDLLTLSYLALKTNPHQVYDWIQVDEAQDVNLFQWNIIGNLVDENSHVIYFGDYEQTIYSFLGSNNQHLKESTSSFQKHQLKINYRSSSNLVRLFIAYSQSILGENLQLIAINDSLKDITQSPMRVVEIVGTLDDELQYIAELILEQNSILPKKHAILSRSNRTSDLVADQLTQLGLIFFKISGFDIFRRAIIKDIMAFMYCLSDEYDRTSWARLLSQFSPVETIKEARRIVTELFGAGIHLRELISNPLEFSTYIQNIYTLYNTKELVIFDTETTGLDCDNDDIIQIAAVKIRGAEIVEEFDIYLLTDKYSEDAYEIHNISKAVLERSGKKRKEGLESFLEFSKDAVLLAHNADFDITILLANLSRINPDEESQYNLEYFDTLAIAKRLYPTFCSYKLSYLLQQLKVPGDNSHNAIDDVMATFNLFCRMMLDSKTVIEAQKIILSKHESILKAFRNKIGELWQNNCRFNQYLYLSDIAESYIAFREKNSISPIKEEDHNYVEKLLKHMHTAFGRKKYEQHIINSIPKYKYYREVDLATGEENIYVSTVHKAKGLEFDVVIIPEAVDDIYPNYYSDSKEKILEDARLLYVAMTRSMNKLILTHHTKKIWGTKVFQRHLSPFIAKLKNQYPINFEKSIDV